MNQHRGQDPDRDLPAWIVEEIDALSAERCRDVRDYAADSIERLNHPEEPIPPRDPELVVDNWSEKYAETDAEVLFYLISESDSWVRRGIRDHATDRLDD